MDVDVAVLGGGPGGYTAAIRAAQLGAKVACIEKEPELGGTCLRVGCIPTKAWVQTAFALKEAAEHFPKFGVNVGETTLDFAASNAWKAGVVKQMTSGVAGLFKANGVEWVKGVGRFKDANTIAVEGGEDVTFKQAVVATGSFPLRPPIPGLDSPRCVDSTGLLAQEQVPKRLAVLGGGIIGCEFASIFRRFGSEVTIIEMLTLIPQEDEDASKELAKQFGKRGITLHLGKQCTRVEDNGSSLVVHFGDGETIEEQTTSCSSRGPGAKTRSSRASGSKPRACSSTSARALPPTSIGARACRTSTPSATAPATGSSRTQRFAEEARLQPENAMRCATPSSTTAPVRVRSTRIPRSPASASPRLQAPREEYGDDVAVRPIPPGLRTPVRSCRTRPNSAWVKSIHETRYGGLLRPRHGGGRIATRPQSRPASSRSTPIQVDRGRRSPTGWHRTRRCRRRSRRPAWRRSAEPFTSRTASLARRRPSS